MAKQGEYMEPYSDLYDLQTLKLYSSIVHALDVQAGLIARLASAQPSLTAEVDDLRAANAELRRTLALMIQPDQMPHL